MTQRIATFAVTALTAVMLVACGSTATTTSTNATAPAAAIATSAPAATADVAISAPAATSAATTEAAATSAPAATADAATSAPAATAATTPGNARTFKIVPAQSEASYSVNELFLKQNTPFNAIGKTNDVTGEFQFSTDGQPTGKVTKITVDLRTLKSDSDRRDNAIRDRWLESNTYPFAEFTSTGVEGVPASYVEGQEITFKLIGDMKIRDITKPVTFDVKGKLQGNTVTGTATTQILMKDFGFDAPSIAGMLSVTDGVGLTVNFTAQEG